MTHFENRETYSSVDMEITYSLLLNHQSIDIDSTPVGTGSNLNPYLVATELFLNPHPLSRSMENKSG